MVYEALGIAVVNAPQEQLDRMAGTAGAALVVPERYMYAGGTLQIDRSWLEGYREGVDALLYRILQGPAAAGPRPAPLQPAATDATWGLVHTGAAASGRRGAGLRIAVLDTGVDQQHPDFAGRRLLAQSFVAGDAVQSDGMSTS